MSTSTPTQTPVPWPMPACTPTAAEPYCINPLVDTEQVMIAHVLLQEGGSCLGEQCMRNIAHVIRNRINDTSGQFPYDTAIGIVSQGNGAAFNAWRMPSAREGSPGWEYALWLADLLISGGTLPAASPGITEQTLYFQSCSPAYYVPVETESNRAVAADVGACAQYYYNSLPTYQCASPALTPLP